MFCFVYQTATDWTNRYCRYIFDLFSTVVELYVVSVNLETIRIRQGSGQVRLSIQPLVLIVMRPCTQSMDL